MSKSCTRCDKVWYKVLVCQTRVIFWSKWGHNAWVQVGHSVSKWHHSEPICCHSGSKWGHCVSKWCQRPECLSGVITRAIVCQNRLIVGHGGSNWGHSGSNCCHSVPMWDHNLGHNGSIWDQTRLKKSHCWSKKSHCGSKYSHCESYWGHSGSNWGHSGLKWGRSVPKCGQTGDSGSK